MSTLSARRLLFAVALGGALLSSTLYSAVLKLCMKDGSYQMVSSYEVKGDRVRYYSTERAQWEEVPTAFVDFDATKRAQAAAKAAEKKQIEDARQTEQERFFKPPAQGMEVAPGLHLPGDDGIFTVDGKRVVRLVQSAGESVTDRKREAIALAVPLHMVKARSLVILDGSKAAIRLSDPLPVFYVQSATGWGANLELLQIKSGKDSRVVEEVETSRGKKGASDEVRTPVPVQRQQVAPNIYTIKPIHALEAGEYALGEVVGDKLSMDVWDFGYEKWEVVK